MERPARETLILTRSAVAELLDLGSCIDAVEQAFRLQGEGRAPAPAILGVHTRGGGFHTKAGMLELSRPYFAAKTNANFMNNRARFGLPTIQGTIVLHDAESGFPLAVMDAIEISILRTGAATAVAAKHLARADAAVVAVAGCGEQGRVQLRSLARVRPLTHARLWDIDRSRAERLAAELAPELGFDLSVVDGFPAAMAGAAIVVTCTPSEEYIVAREHVAPGMFIAGVGVDNPHKRELAPAVLAQSLVVTDVTHQCAAGGDLHHALNAGVMDRSAVHAELGAVVAGRAAARQRGDEVFVFDSTGMALQDVASAAVVYERALERGVGLAVEFSS